MTDRNLSHSWSPLELADGKSSSDGKFQTTLSQFFNHFLGEYFMKLLKEENRQWSWVAASNKQIRICQDKVSIISTISACSLLSWLSQNSTTMANIFCFQWLTRIKIPRFFWIWQIDKGLELPTSSSSTLHNSLRSPCRRHYCCTHRHTIVVVEAGAYQAKPTLPFIWQMAQSSFEGPLNLLTTTNCQTFISCILDSTHYSLTVRFDSIDDRDKIWNRYHF